MHTLAILMSTLFAGSPLSPSLPKDRPRAERRVDLDEQGVRRLLGEEEDIDAATLESEEPEDDTRFAPGTSFVKKWKLRNTGTSTWNRENFYKLEYRYGDLMGASTPVELGEKEAIAPNQTKEWSVPMTAPSEPGSYRAYWAFRGFLGLSILENLKVQIIVTKPDPLEHDLDGDGYPDCKYVQEPDCDCDDDDPEVYPGAPPRCNGKDNGCHYYGRPDIPPPRDCGRPGSPCAGKQYCVELESEWTWTACDGAQPTREECNGKDDDCNGIVDDGNICPCGEICLHAVCVPISEPDAGMPEPTDAAIVTEPDAGADAGGSSGNDGGTGTGKFDGGGCGCSSFGLVASESWMFVMLVIGALGLRRRGGVDLPLSSRKH